MWNEYRNTLQTLYPKWWYSQNLLLWTCNADPMATVDGTETVDEQWEKESDL